MPVNSPVYNATIMLASFLAAGLITADMIQTGTLAAVYTLTGHLIVGDPVAAHADIYTSSGVVYIDMFNASNVKRSSWTYNGLDFFDATGAVVTRIATTTADATITVGSGMDYEEISDAEHSLPYFIMHDITINVYSGDYSGFIVNPHDGPGMITIRVYTGETATVGYIYAYNCQCLLSIINFTATSTTKSGFQFWSCSDVRLLNCSTTVSAGTQYGIYYANAKGSVTNGTISNRGAGVLAAGRSLVNLSNVAGSGNGTAIQCTDSVIFIGYANTIVGTVQNAAYQGGIITPLSGIDFSKQAISGLKVYTVQMGALAGVAYKYVDLDITADSWAVAPKVFAIQSELVGSSGKLVTKVDSNNITTTNIRVYVYSGDGSNVTCNAFDIWLLAIGEAA
jgi:hypothetical protein